MSARDDYPKLANKADNQRVWFSGAECERALDEIDSLRTRLNAADSTTAPIVDCESDEGMLREAHDLLRLVQWRQGQTPAAWLADDLCLRIAARYPGPADVVTDRANPQATNDQPTQGEAP